MFQRGDLFLYQSKYGSRTFGEVKTVEFKTVIALDCDYVEYYVTSTNGVEYKQSELLKVKNRLSEEDKIFRKTYLESVKNRNEKFMDPFQILKIEEMVKNFKKP